MATAELINPNPVVYQRKDGAPRKVISAVDVAFSTWLCMLINNLPWREYVSISTCSESSQARLVVPDESEREPIDAVEIFDHIRDIADPEHPYSLEQLNVVETDLIDVSDVKGRVR
jgi:hypothetical protein